MFEIALPAARAIFTTREGGVSDEPFASRNLGLKTSDELVVVRQNIDALKHELGLSSMQLLNQVHGSSVEVVEAVDGRAEVYLDGGVRRGTDVVTALALGARAVLVGRPVMYGLAFGGAKGVEQVLGILREETENALALLGCRSPDDVSRAHVSTAFPT